MKRNPIILLFILAILTACSTNENQSNTPPQSLPSINEEVDTIFLGVEEEKPISNNSATQPKKEYKDIKGSQLPAIIQEIYQNAEKAMQKVVSPIPENTSLIPKETTYFYDETLIGKYFSSIIPQNEVITFTPSMFEAVSIRGKEGTIITFPPACLVDENGNPVTTPVQIELKECYKLKDMLFANLSTTFNDMLLQTGGMVYINATSNGKALHLMAIHPILIEMPTKDKKEGMELFYGEKMLASGVMNWHIADSKKRKKIVEKEDMKMVNAWEKLDEPTKIYDIGEIELGITLKEGKTIDGTPEIVFEILAINPKLKKYKQIITTTLNQVAWEKDQKAKASGKALYEYKQQCLLGNIIFANLNDLLAIREEIAKYKNFQFRKSIPLQAHLNKDFYYKKKGLMNDYVFQKAAWQEDNKFFETNFPRVKASKNNSYETMLAEIQASKESLMDSYTAHYALSYLFTTNQMGWFNCNIYDYNTGEKINLMVDYEGRSNTDIKLIIAENRIIIPARDLGKKIVFTSVPIGKKAVLFGIKLIHDIPFFCLKEIIIGKSKDLEMTDFKQMSMAELEEEMKRLGIAS